MADGTNAQRQARHQQRYEMLVSLFDLALARRPDLAAGLGAEIAGILGDNPTLCDSFDTLFDRRPRATPHKLTTSLTYTTVINAQSGVTNGLPTVTNGRLPGGGGGASRSGRTSPISPSPLRGDGEWDDSRRSLTNHSQAVQPLMAERHVARQRDECFERLCDGLYPPFKGQYDRLDPPTRSALNGALARIQAKMDAHGVPTERRPDLITYAIGRLPNVGGARTPFNLAKKWTECVAGADRNGRDNGTVRTRYLNETAQLKHQPKLDLK